MLVQHFGNKDGKDFGTILLEKAVDGKFDVATALKFTDNVVSFHSDH